MTPTEVKQAHDEIWAARKKIGLKRYKEFMSKQDDGSIKWFIDMTITDDKGFWKDIPFNNYKQVRRFLDGLEERGRICPCEDMNWLLLEE